MTANGYILLIYALFLLFTLVVNLLYFFQVFKYRLPGDASLTVLSAHIILMLLVLFGGSLFIRL